MSSAARPVAVCLGGARRKGGRARCIAPGAPVREPALFGRVASDPTVSRTIDALAARSRTRTCGDQRRPGRGPGASVGRRRRACPPATAWLPAAPTSPTNSTREWNPTPTPSRSGPSSYPGVRISTRDGQTRRQACTQQDHERSRLMVHR